MKTKMRTLDPRLLDSIKKIGVRLGRTHYDVVQILADHSFELDRRGKRSWLTQNLGAPKCWAHFVNNADGTTDVTWYERHDDGSFAKVGAKP